MAKCIIPKNGKYMKAFGCDDFDALKAISKEVKVCCISADKRGFPIVEKRIKDEMGLDLFLVSNKPQERWDWISEKFKEHFIVFVGDGIYDWIALKNADLSFTVKDALQHVKNSADIIVNRERWLKSDS